MPRTSKAKPAVDAVVAEESAATASVAADGNVDDVAKEKASEKPKPESKRVSRANVALKDSDEIEVISLIPNVNYLDDNTLDVYKWESVGDVEIMTFAELKNMWRKHKGYFRNLWLKPEDDRVIRKFGLERIYDKYDFLMDKSNYTKSNIGELCEDIASSPNNMKIAIVNKIKDLVSNGEVSDVNVIKALEKQLGIDFLSFIK